MKQIPLLQGKALLIELPEGAKHKRIEVRHLGCFLVTTSTRGELMAKLPPGNWRIIGMLSEVTEKQANNLVDRDDSIPRFFGGYKDYLSEDLMCTTALISLESAILAEGYYLDENPIAVPDFSGGNIRFSETVEYAKAQSRVLCRERCLLLGRIGG